MISQQNKVVLIFISIESNVGDHSLALQIKTSEESYYGVQAYYLDFNKYQVVAWSVRTQMDFLQPQL